ncbi:MAG: hypothetical protein IJR99_08170 [Kiritimatiellae bacterium]|nr:hypothetical protein [Kiritimatiellia bacterium]
MREIVCCDSIAQTNVYFLKLADYLAGEKMISTTDWWEKVKLAREKDEALIAAGEIQPPPVVTGGPYTPNLSALRQEYDHIRDYNQSLFVHRKRVAAIFAERMEQYLRSLNEEEAEGFCKLFSKRAGLTEKEEDRFFPERAKKKQDAPQTGQDRVAQQDEFPDIGIASLPFDFLRRRPDEPLRRDVGSSGRYCAGKEGGGRNKLHARNGRCGVDQDEIMEAFKKGLSDPDIIICQIDCEPLFQKAEKEGFFADTNPHGELLSLVAGRVLANRISQEDWNAWERFHSMEYFMKRIVCFDEIARTNIYFLKLADYLAAEKTIPTPDKEKEWELAKKKDQALAASGVKERPVVIVNRYVPPNERAWWQKYGPIENWNIWAGKHRHEVAWIFAERLGQYLRSLKKEDAEAFRKLFTERAKLSKEEESLFFPQKGGK